MGSHQGSEQRLRIFDGVTVETYDIVDDKIKAEPYVRSVTAMQVHLYNMREWSPTETRVLFFMLATCDQGNMVHSTSGEIREVLDVTAAQLSKAIAGLVEKNLIVKTRFVGRSFFFMVNPAYFRRFEEKMLPAYLREYQQMKVIMQEREGLPKTPPESQTAYLERKQGKAAQKRIYKRQRGVIASAAAED